MEDTVIKLNHYAYSFRVDVNIDNGLTRIMEFLKKYDVKHYICGAEVSDKGKQHFQCILWFDKKINTAKLRNWWKGKTLDTKQPVSLTSAKKIKNLGKYTMKEKNFITNLSKEEIENIGKWSPKKKAAEWAQILDEHAKKFREGGTDEISRYWTAAYETDYHNSELMAFLCYMLDFYKANAKRPSRVTLQYLAWKHGHMTNFGLVRRWF